MSLKVTVVDEQTGETQTAQVPDGDYLLLVTAPAWLAQTQTFLGKGKHVLTIDGRSERSAIGITRRFLPPANPSLMGSVEKGSKDRPPTPAADIEPMDAVLADAVVALAAARLWLVGEYADRPHSEFNAEAWKRLADSVGPLLTGRPGWIHTARTFRLIETEPHDA